MNKSCEGKLYYVFILFFTVFSPEADEECSNVCLGCCNSVPAAGAEKSCFKLNPSEFVSNMRSVIKCFTLLQAVWMVGPQHGLGGEVRQTEHLQGLHGGPRALAHP